MSTKFVSRALLAALVITALGGLLNSTAAKAGHLLNQTGCQRCQECGHTCKLEAEKVDVDDKCFEVEEKVICIQRVVFPWQTGQGCFGHGKKKGCDSCDGRGCDSCNTCVNNGAKTRKIRILKSSKKPGCPVCEYSWSAEKKPCAPCANGCKAGCCDSGCAAAGCDAAPVYVEPMADVLPEPVSVQ